MEEKTNEKQQILRQDLSEKEDRPGGIFLVHLLMEEACALPSREKMMETMTRHLGALDCVNYDDKSAACFSPREYLMESEDGKSFSPILFVSACEKIEKPILNELELTQLWDCPDGEEILASCPYQIIASDMMAAGLDYKQRAKMLVHYMQALAELFPTAMAFVFETSKKMLTTEEIASCEQDWERCFLRYAVNIRFFKIRGTDDCMVDSVGMSTLFLPDVQYHYHGLKVEAVVKHAYDVLIYMFDQDCPFENGDSVAGLREGQYDDAVPWKVYYEEALIQPVRQVVDIDTGEYAAGEREE